MNDGPHSPSVGVIVIVAGLFKPSTSTQGSSKPTYCLIAIVGLNFSTQSSSGVMQSDDPWLSARPSTVIVSWSTDAVVGFVNEAVIVDGRGVARAAVYVVI